ncbi:NAD(P)/FAD-dependent oxidoreductase [Paraburkholderia caballeronis]|uniref:NAD(P)/FAD-dependent oxidoreductase n=1 Tax=Paraburkholderia caballeronis TaxID=416943 RepID=UPI001066A9A1|nr:FAD-binding oxidoreductase [Paraburkholderia caballeronis]TDV14977.1 glycine/D-amino acid oxidase-like deaminating enzyme [Paraburkholderia caballeronis]TDV16899.1 glycine/D-amino acid oxidase-like deaminating enzyme [Paraburkholderia caballeronis]TDV25713.1 glycine/D-amino acid oxidase-like deaminating enzyme [Paraburkholderia caballeronis]
MDFEVIVLGAGIVGVSAALHLQDRGRRVALIDRRGPGEETSYGNAGLIERSSVVPYGFPRSATALLRYALNRSTDLYWDYRSLPSYATWLARFWWESAPQRHAAAARDMLPLIERSVAEHDALAARADAQSLVHANGWLQAIHTPARFELDAARAERVAREHGLRVTALDAAALRAREPSLAAGFAGALHWLDPKTVANPGELVARYARLFETDGGAFRRGDTATLRRERNAWTVQTADGLISANEAVIAMGPWSDLVFEPLGYRIPLRAKRGYHMHYRPQRGTLSMPVVDTERGYAIAPMQQGIRLTTGVELATRDTPPTGVQLARAETIARPLFGLGDRLDAEPWLGMRPCTPDMRPVIGPAPRHPGLWFAFGHNHHGLTLGPVSGKLLAQMMTGEPTFTDPRPYRAERFG